MKKTIDNASFFTFFTTLNLTWPKFCPNTTPTLGFFGWFPMKYVTVVDSININNCNWNPVVLKKMC